MFYIMFAPSAFVFFLAGIIAMDYMESFFAKRDERKRREKSRKQFEDDVKMYLERTSNGRDGSLQG
jgi:hypothetical protein